MRRLGPLLLLVALTACGAGHHSSTISRSALPRLVLQPADLGSRFLRFDEGAQIAIDVHPGPREDLQRFGRLGGWKARYKRADSSR